MTQLAANVDADDELWTVDSLPTTPYIEAGSELVEIRSRFPSQTYTLTGAVLPPRIRVRRGIAGTTPASHLSGVPLTPTYGLGGGGAGGGGAISVDNTVDPPSEVTTIITAGADVSTPGEATFVSFPVGWSFDDLIGGLVVDPTGTYLLILMGDPQEEDPFTKIEPGKVSIAASGVLLTLKDIVSTITLFDVGAGDGTRIIDTSGNIQIQVTADGDVMMPTLPTANPNNAGQLWNDAGTLKVSAG